MVITVVLPTTGVSIACGVVLVVGVAVGVVVAVVTESWGTSSGMSMRLGLWVTCFGMLSNKVFIVPIAEVPVISGVVRVGVVAEVAAGGA